MNQQSDQWSYPKKENDPEGNRGYSPLISLEIEEIGAPLILASGNYYSFHFTDCPMEEDVHYHGHDLNDGNSDPHMPNAEACASHCKEKYPEAFFFTWISDAWVEQHSFNTCWCKSECAVNEKRLEKGIVSGPLQCLDGSSGGKQNWKMSELQKRGLYHPVSCSLGDIDELKE